MNKTNRLFPLIYAVGMVLAISAGHAQAQSFPPFPNLPALPIPLTISAAVTLQGAVTPTGNANNPGFKYATAKATITNAIIMQQIEISNGNTAKDVPKGAKLIYNLDGDGSVSMTDSTGTNELFNAAGILDVVLDPNATGGVWSGTENETTGAQSYAGSYLVEIVYTDNNGNAFIITGLAAEKYSISAPNSKTGNQTVADSITVATGVGDGFFSAADGSPIPAAGTGKLSGSVKATLSGN
jgi:hypothetical protein